MTIRGTSAQSEDGAVLLVVLAALTILVLLATAAGDILRGRSLLAESSLVALKREAAIRSVVALGAARILAPGPARWRVDGRSYDVRVPGAQGKLSIQSAGGLINLNRVSVPLLRAFLGSFMEKTAAVDLVDAFVADRRARFSLGSGSSVSAGRAARHLIAYPDPAAAAPLFPSGLWSRIGPFLTIYGPTETIDPATAPREVLKAIPGMSEEDLAMLLNARAKDEVRSAAIESMLVRYRPFLTGTDDGVYRLTATLRVDGTGGFWRQEVVIMTGRDAEVPFRTLAWGWPEEVGNDG